LQRGIASRSRARGAKEGARVIVNGAIEQIKSRGAKAILGFVIDALD
jgi:hypothetical protein